MLAEKIGPEEGAVWAEDVWAEDVAPEKTTPAERGRVGGGGLSRGGDVVCGWRSCPIEVVPEDEETLAENMGYQLLLITGIMSSPHIYGHNKP